MGELPKPRVTQAKVFSHCGVDFAGPFSIIMGRPRGLSRLKAYVCVFVYFAVKTIYLELVSDLTSAGFLGALRRLVAGRRQCTDLCSDCGTNFVGANNLLHEYMQSAGGSCAIKWHCNPPSAPHKGGLWEAVLNSRPLCLISADNLDDLLVLTPGHFLTTGPMVAIPDERR